VTVIHSKEYDCPSAESARIANRYSLLGGENNILVVFQPDSFVYESVLSGSTASHPLDCVKYKMSAESSGNLPEVNGPASHLGKLDTLFHNVLDVCDTGRGLQVQPPSISQSQCPYRNLDTGCIQGLTPPIHPFCNCSPCCNSMLY
jgi:hypothetical protein